MNPEFNPKLTTILFSDIEGSTALKEFGIDKWYPSLKRHNDLFEAEIARFGAKARVIKHMGDGYLAQFESPADAVLCAARFQFQMTKEKWPHDLVLRSRVGIHFGNASEIFQADQPDIVGRAVDLAARVMSLARGGQVLLSKTVYDAARDLFPHGKTIDADLPPLEWREHGQWGLKGIDEPVTVYEAILRGLATIEAPSAGEKAWRWGDAPEQQSVRWVAQAGVRIPSKNDWTVVELLGRGALGEAWLCQKGKDKHVFRFFTDTQSRRAVLALGALNNELKKVDHPDISRYVETNDDTLPYYLETEYADGRDLITWAATHGEGLARLSLPQRLDLVARIAEAAAAAHRVGVIHGDINPKNILIKERSGESVEIRPQLDDFGARRIFYAAQVPLTGGEAASAGVTRVDDAQLAQYVAPELKKSANEPFTTQSDVYSLGVLLYHLVVANLHSGVPKEKSLDEISDHLLRQDVRDCIAADPGGRPPASQLAAQLRSLDKRHADEEAAIARKKTDQRRKRIVQLVAVAACLFLGALSLSSLWRVYSEQTRALAVKQFMIDTLRSIDPNQSGRLKDFTLESYLKHAGGRLGSGALDLHPGAHAEVLEAIARAYLAIPNPPEALRCLREAKSLGERWSDRPADFETRIRIAEARALLSRGDSDGRRDADKIINELAAQQLSEELAIEILVARATLHAGYKSHEPAAKEFEEAEARLAKLGGGKVDTLYRVEMTFRAAEMYCEAGDFKAAVARSADVERRLDHLKAGDSELFVSNKVVRGKVASREGRFDDAIGELSFVYETRKKQFGPQNLRTAFAAGDIADVCHKAGRLDEAVRYREPGRMYAQLTDTGPSLAHYFNSQYGIALVRAKRPAEAREVLQAATDAYAKLSADDRRGEAEVLQSLVNDFLGTMPGAPTTQPRTAAIDAAAALGAVALTSIRE